MKKVLLNMPPVLFTLVPDCIRIVGGTVSRGPSAQACPKQTLEVAGSSCAQFECEGPTGTETQVKAGVDGAATCAAGAEA